jgi:sterol desaturase/sphingolipid hydroxylase (fatty acid hydroxylase superfamily)
MGHTELKDMSRSEALKASPPMFKSNLLDKLSRVHPVVPLIIFVPVIVGLAIAGGLEVGLPASVLWFAGGWLFWTLTEYWLHRIVFHFDADNEWAHRFHFMIHGVHHDHPNDPLRLVMPPGASIPLASIFLLIFWSLLPGGSWMVFASGFLAGYLTYDMLHFHVHHHRPRTALGRKLRELHMRHHFQDHSTGFGVSAPFWDHVFGTKPKTTNQG